VSKLVTEAFGLSYASYLVVPRLVLESMPEDWQRRFVSMTEECHERFEFDRVRYTVAARDDNGRFVDDPLRDYRRGVAPRAHAAQDGGR
jgi:hypothetical protein